MKSFGNVQKSIVMFLTAFLLTACGGGSGDPALSNNPSTYSLSGTVASSGSGLQGVMMALSGSSSATVTTDAGGNYSFTGLANGSYTITPSKAGYTFTPANMAVTINGATVTGQNWNWTNDPAQNERYINTLFSSVDITENVVYASSSQLNFPYLDETGTTQIGLTMDIYTPRGDTQTERPAIIFVHGGAFVSGNKNHDDMTAFCTEFARKGYVTASINYRLGMNVTSAMSATRAVYRGLQDGRSAVRFLRKNAVTYGIDAGKVFMAGSSAGGFIALQAVYMNETAEKPVEAGVYPYVMPGLPPTIAPDLGGYDHGANTDMNGTPDAIMSLWGAVKNTDLITSSDLTPVFLVHGKVDTIVPFGTGSPFGWPFFPATYGSSSIYDKLTQLGSVEKLSYFVDGQGHEFYGVLNGSWRNGTGGNEYWNIILEKAVGFFYGQLVKHGTK